MKLALVLFLSISACHLSAQDINVPKVTFGEYNLADLDMKSYEKDSSAEAVILYNVGNYRYSFDSDYPKVIYEYHQRIKILKKSGLERGTIVIPFRHDSNPERQEFVKDIKGMTYNLEDGSAKLTELTRNSIFEEKSSNGFREMKIVFPKVKEGSVIELSYTLVSPLWYFLRTWEFQKDIPVVWSGVRAVIPGYYDYKLTYFGYHPFYIKNTLQGSAVFIPSANALGEQIKQPYLLYDFAMKDIPAIKSDDYMTTVEDYRSSIDFELARTFSSSGLVRNYSVTYDDLTKTLLESGNFGGALKKFSKAAKKIAQEITAKSASKDTLAIIGSAYEHVRNTIQWNGESRLFTTRKLEQVYEEKSGNSSEINLILVGILNELGFSASPVVLSTRSHGKVLKEIALMDRFNYSVAHLSVNGKDFMLDATDKYVNMNMLPKRCLNELGWMISKKPRWVSLVPTVRKQISNYLSFSIEDDQKLKGSVVKSYFGYADVERKSDIKSAGEAKFIDGLKKQYPQFENPVYTLKESEKKETIIDCQTTVNEAYSVAGDRIFLYPLLWETTKDNPFVQAERMFPVDFGHGLQEITVGQYKIPEGYSIESMPEHINLVLPNNKGRYLFMIKAENGTIELMSQLLIAKVTFKAEEYHSLREMFNQMIAKQNEQIVLKKNN